MRSPSTDLWVACGGIVSDEGEGSVVGCDEVPTVRPILPPSTTETTLAPIPTTTLVLNVLFYYLLKYHLILVNGFIETIFH